MARVPMVYQPAQPPATDPALQELTNNDLALLLNILNPVAPNCFALGLQLGMTYPEVQQIMYDYKKCKDQLREIIAARLRQESPLTWHDIIRALRADVVSERGLAHEIEFNIDNLPFLASVASQTNTVSLASSAFRSSVLSALLASHYNPALIHTSHAAIHAAQPALTNPFLPHSSCQSHMPTPHSAYYHHTRPPQYLLHNSPHPYPKPAPFLIPPVTAQPLDVDSYASDRPSQSDWSTPHPPSIYPPHHMQPAHQTDYPDVTRPNPHLPSPYVPPLQEGMRDGQWNSQSQIPTSSQSQYSSPNDRMLRMFIDYVRNIYKESEVERDTEVVKWPPTPSTVYINLACINRKHVGGKSKHYAEITEAMVRDGNVDVIDQTKDPIEFSEIVEGISIPSGKVTDSREAIQQRRLILVEGAPGVGKSTFAKEFCRRWERGLIAQQYQLVLLLRLRDDRMSKAKNLKDLIYHPLEDVSQAVSEELMLSYNFHVLIILEGFDELPDHCRKKQSIFFELISGKLLPLATVLVTSRPWATKRIRENHGNRIYQHIEILGFTSHQITEYIERALPEDKVGDLKAYLEKYPQIRMGMYIPLNSAIVVTVYQESQESGCALPTTLTELYTAMVQTLLLRYLRGNSQYEIATMQTFNDLPPAVHTKFYNVCKLAYRGIVGTSDQVQLIFTGLPSDFDSLGLMDSVTELYVTQGAVSSYNFLHLTFQEYFAAVHISTLSLAEQLEHFKRHKEGRLKVVLRFMAGLKSLSCFSKETVHHFLTPPQDEGSGPYIMPVDVGVPTDLVNWMFEAQSNDVIALALGRKTVQFSIAQYMLPLDFYGLGYCIVHSKCQWMLSMEGSVYGDSIWPIREEDLRMLGFGVNTTQQPSGRVVGLKGGEHAVPIEVLNMLLTEWKSVLHLHELALRLPVACDSITWPDTSALRVLSLDIGGQTNWRLDTLLPHLTLESLTIWAYNSNDCLVYEDCVAIADHIIATTYLKELCFAHCDTDSVDIDNKGLEAITKALAGNQSLPLERLKLEWGCTFSNTAANCLVQFISNTTTLKYLRMWQCLFSVHGLLELLRAVYRNSTLQEKGLEDLSYTVNGDNDAKYLAQLLVEFPQVESEQNKCTQISDAGAVAIAQALHHNSTLKRLDLSQNSISDAGAVAIAQALHYNSTLEWLNLSDNSIGDTGAIALARGLHCNHTLKWLNLSGNSISEIGVVYIILAQPLQCNSILKRFLSEYNISDVYGVDVVQDIYHNPTLRRLFTKSIGEEGTHQLVYRV